MCIDFAWVKLTDIYLILNKMEVTILGTNGFLSQAIATYCNVKGYTLHMFGLNKPIGHVCNTFHHINLKNEELDIDKLLQSDIVIYAIGAGIQSNLKEGTDLIYNLNVTAPIKICNALRNAGYKGCMVTFGSVFEMGETKDERFFTENEILTSIYPAASDYTVSKRLLSRFVDSYAHDFTHWHFFIPTIYGETENPLRLIPYTIHALRYREPLHFTTGNQTRQYVYVSEIPRMIDLAYKKKLPNGLYNIQGKDTLTVREIVTAIHKHYNKDVPVDCFGTASRADVGMKYLALDGTKLKNAIGFEAKISLTDVLDKY